MANEYGKLGWAQLLTYAEQYIEDARLKHRGQAQEDQEYLQDTYGQENGDAILEMILDILPPDPRG